MTREEAIEGLKYLVEYDDYGSLHTDEIKMAIQALQEQKVGKWKAYVDYGNHRHWLCSCCGEEGYKTKFCAECGAKMEGVEE